MATQCPKCHEMLDADYICCAEIKFTWKCKSCSKVSQGFNVPYGRCHLCGGAVEVIEIPKDVEYSSLEPIQVGLQLESNAYHFYRLAAKKSDDPEVTEVFKDFQEKEKEHYDTIANRYHVHENLNIDEHMDEKIMGWLMEGIDFSSSRNTIRSFYDKAIEMEIKTRDFYKECVEKVKSETEKEIYRELVAEEDEHAVILETERDAFFGKD